MLFFNQHLISPQHSVKKIERHKRAENAMFADFLLVTRSMYMRKKKKRNNHEVSAHGLTMPRENDERSPSNPKDDDGVCNYSHNIMQTGLLLRDFQDAIKEGDGGRLEHLWKFYDASLQSY